jgi:hypothetical protein
VPEVWVRDRIVGRALCSLCLVLGRTSFGLCAESVEARRRGPALQSIVKSAVPFRLPMLPIRSRTSRLGARDRIVVTVTALGGLLTAAPGVHLFELLLPPTPAIIVSHGLAAFFLGVAAYQWRARRARASQARSSAD